MTEKVKGYGHEGKLYVSYRGIKGIVDNGCIYWSDGDDIYTAESVEQFKKQVNEAYNARR